MAKPTSAKVKLIESDWDALFPSKQFVIGTSKIDIAPLSIEELASVLNKLSEISDKIQENVPSDDLAEGLTKSSVTIINLVRVIMQESPDILSDISNIDVDDVRGLPLDKALELFNFCLDVNIESQESLIKNFEGLATRMTQFMGNKKTTSPAPLIQNKLEA